VFGGSAAFKPGGLPEDVKARLVEAVETAYNSEEYQNFMKERGFGLLWHPADEAAAFIGKSDEDLGKVMQEAGLAKQ